MDWRNFYLGAWLTPIKMKMVLAVILLLLSGAAVLLSFKGRESSKITLVLYSLCLAVVISLGWFGGRLVYGEKDQGKFKKLSNRRKIFLLPIAIFVMLTEEIKLVPLSRCATLTI